QRPAVLLQPHDRGWIDTNAAARRHEGERLLEGGRARPGPARPDRDQGHEGHAERDQQALSPQERDPQAGLEGVRRAPFRGVALRSPASLHGAPGAGSSTRYSRRSSPLPARPQTSRGGLIRVTFLSQLAASTPGGASPPAV